jgi:ABC-2 type transport system permease protein
MGAIIEEKESRIAEILFSSALPFQLMTGKLAGVGSAALTQMAIWCVSGLILLGYGAVSAGALGFTGNLPGISPIFMGYILLFFLLGFFTYATMYAIIGAIVRTAQEGQQFMILPMLVSLLGLVSTFSIVRDPNSSFSFWTSISPFVGPLVMPIRIFSETPPLWQIILAIATNFGAIVGLTWIAAKIYRIGMLMYGKRPTIPEIWRWVNER